MPHEKEKNEISSDLRFRQKLGKCYNSVKVKNYGGISKNVVRTRAPVIVV